MHTNSGLLPAYGILLGALLWIGGCGTTAEDEAERRLASHLNFYNWSYYIGETTISDFQDRTGVRVRYDNYSSNEEVLARLQAGVSGYDVVVPSDYMVEVMVSLDLLSPLNHDNLPNMVHMNPDFIDLPFDPENRCSIPYQWGSAGIGVNVARVPEFEESWDLLWDETYSGRISMLDDMRSGLVPALKRLGYSVNTTNELELEEALELMAEQKPLVRAYTSDTFIDLLKSGDIWIAYGWSGDIYQVAKENPDIRFIIPKEGTYLWVDNMVIPRSAPSPYTAEVFMNYIMDPHICAGITNTTWYASPNLNAIPHIHPEITGDPNIYLPDEIMEQSEFLQDVGENTRLYERIWSRLKSQ
ncbi:MAG: spermidine/putrescine ABC transporter substrate-binding protein [Cyclonatronaceae bacterium]